ncbi:MAG: hypothetical protein WCJ13_04185 [Coriobacteriia bacterium]
MAITRRQFVTRMGTLAAAAGMSQADFSQITQAFAGNTNGVFGGGGAKPKIIWIHGAECTGCSTSLLGILEDGGSDASGYGQIYGTPYTTGAALGLMGVTNALGGAFPTLGEPTRTDIYTSKQYKDTNYTTIMPANSEPVNIADVVIDIIDLQYHETVMGMGGDLATQWLADFQTNGEDASPFVLVVEGAVQKMSNTGAWGDSGTSIPWCSIGVANDGSKEQDMPTVVENLATMAKCVKIIAIGQCAAFGGYPGCKPQITAAVAMKDAGGFDPTESQTGAQGVYDFLLAVPAAAAAAKVVNVPGCPTNPWWFVLTTCLVVIDLVKGTSLVTLDSQRRPELVYPIPVHSSYCPNYGFYNQGVYASAPGERGCLMKIGCKGLAANSLCGIHGWNNQQPENKGSLSPEFNPAANGNSRGGHCTRAGAPCMACTEQGYPDSFVPFVTR